MATPIQNIMDTIYDATALESETAASKVRDAFRSLIQLIEAPQPETTRLKARVDALEAEVAELKAKEPRG
jgi:polyhydroxyalkanoate synthesis regulator phasin